MKEPFIGEELIRILLEAYEVHFVFADTVLQIGSSFSVAVEGRARADFNPAERRGEVLTIWALIGEKVRHTVWDGDVIVLFENGSEIRIPATQGHIRGSIVGRHKAGDKFIFQDF